MQSPFSFRNTAILVVTGLTIGLVFTQGILSAVLFAGLFYFAGSLVEVYQRRNLFKRGRLILYTGFYTLAILLILAFFIWRYRELFFLA